MYLGEPLIINLAPTGMVPTRAMSPHVPLQPDEIVKDVLACAEIGISMVHVHARDLDGVPAWDKDIYARIIGGIRERRPELIIGVSCSGRNFPAFEQRSAVLDLDGDLKPDTASLTLASLNFGSQASVNSPEMVQALAARMVERGILPELEIFDLGMANYARYLVDKGKLPGALYANLLFGNIATAQADLLSIGAVVASLPPSTVWSLAGIGSDQIPICAVAAASAPGVRVGLEDNLWMDGGRKRLATNSDLVRRVHDLAAHMGRSIMGAQDLRTRLGLEARR